MNKLFLIFLTMMTLQNSNATNRQITSFKENRRPSNKFLVNLKNNRDKISRTIPWNNNPNSLCGGNLIHGGAHVEFLRPSPVQIGVIEEAPEDYIRIISPVRGLFTYTTSTNKPHVLGPNSNQICEFTSGNGPDTRPKINILIKDFARGTVNGYEYKFNFYTSLETQTSFEGPRTNESICDSIIISHPNNTLIQKGDVIGYLPLYSDPNNNPESRTPHLHFNLTSIPLDQNAPELKGSSSNRVPNHQLCANIWGNDIKRNYNRFRDNLPSGQPRSPALCSQWMSPLRVRSEAFCYAPELDLSAPINPIVSDPTEL